MKLGMEVFFIGVSAGTAVQADIKMRSRTAMRGKCFMESVWKQELEIFLNKLLGLDDLKLDMLFLDQFY